MRKLNTIDLFAGCGGLCDGFEQSNKYNTIACVEWEKAPCANLEKHLREKWHYADAERRVLRFDIQRTDELINGWEDKEYGSSDGLDKLVGSQKVDVIIGGPPCQAYSLAGRIRDEHGMKNDYRNFLFESYIRVLEHYKPSVFIFENVPGLLSAKPTGAPIVNIISKAFDDAGYEILDNLKHAQIDFSEYGVPQKRDRIIILGLNKTVFKSNRQELLRRFYDEILPKYKTEKETVREAISDLPKLYPLKEDKKIDGKKYSHSLPDKTIKNHEPRYHSKRDQYLFNLLANDIESGENRYTSIEMLKKLYKETTGHDSNVHKYYVIRWNEQSNLIPAHLYKDGLRHIHPDPSQARSITVREAARLQGFSDDYEFVGTQADAYKMIGNAVPPKFSEKLANAVYELLLEEENVI